MLHLCWKTIECNDALMNPIAGVGWFERMRHWIHPRCQRAWHVTRLWRLQIHLSSNNHPNIIKGHYLQKNSTVWVIHLVPKLNVVAIAVVCKCRRNKKSTIVLLFTHSLTLSLCKARRDIQVWIFKGPFFCDGHIHLWYSMVQFLTEWHARPALSWCVLVLINTGAHSFVSTYHN